MSKRASVSAPVQTPGNILEVNRIIDKIKLGQHTELELTKFSNPTSKTFAKYTTLAITNKALLEKDEMKKQKNYSKKQLGKGQIMGQKVLDERKTITQLKKSEKEYWDVWKNVISFFKEATQEAEREAACRQIAIIA